MASLAAAPATAGHTSCTRASVVAGRELPLQRRERVRQRPRAEAPQRDRLLRELAGHDRHRGHPVPCRARHVLQVGRGDDRLAARREQLDQAFATSEVEFRHDVVEKHEGRAAARIEQNVALREEEREQTEPLLPLGPVRAKLPASVCEDELVPVRAVRGEAALEVVVAALTQLFAERFRIRCPAARTVGQRRLLGEAEIDGALAEAGCDERDTPRIGPTSRPPPRGRARSPTCRAGPDPPLPPGRARSAHSAARERGCRPRGSAREPATAP